MARFSKEERYLLKVCEMVQASCDVEIDRYKVGQQVKMNPKAVDNLVKRLVRGNIFEKRGEVMIVCTSFGLKLAKELLNST